MTKKLSEESEPHAQPQLMRTHQKVALGAGLVLTAMVMVVWYTYSVAFFERVLRIPAKSTGTIVLVGQVSAAISAPLVGVWSDQLKVKFGRRKITHLAGATAAALSLVFLWHKCITCSNSPSVYQTVYFASFAALCFTGTVTTQTAIYSLIPELASDEKTNVELNSIW